MAKEIKFNIKLFVDGKEQLTTATADVKELGDAVGLSRKQIKMRKGVNRRQHTNMEA